MLSRDLSVARGQTAVLLWFYQQMLQCTMRLCPNLYPEAPAVRQFTSAYYLKLALKVIRFLTVALSLTLMTHLK